MATSNMILTLPTEGGSDGVWDTEINAALTLIDAHDHTAGKGVTVPTGGIGINADLTFAGFAGTNLKATRFTAQASISALTSGLCVKSTDDELYWVSSGGTEVKLTSGAGINTALVGGITGDYSTTNANLIYSDAEKVFQFIQDDTTTPDTWALIASEIHRIYPAGTGALYVALKSPALAGSYTITFPAAVPASTSVVTMTSAGVLATTRNLDVDDIQASGAVTLDSTFHAIGAISGSSTIAATGAVTAGGLVAATTGLYHGDTQVQISLADGYSDVVVGTAAVNFATKHVTMTNGESIMYGLRLPIGARVKSIGLRFNAAAAGTITASLHSAADKVNAVIDTGGSAGTGATTGHATTIGTPVAVSALTNYYVVLNFTDPSPGTAEVYSLWFTFDRPAP